MIWKTIKDYPKYEISSTGLVRHKERKKLLKFRENCKGYYMVDLSYDHSKPVHQ